MPVFYQQKTRTLQIVRLLFLVTVKEILKVLVTQNCRSEVLE